MATPLSHTARACRAPTSDPHRTLGPFAQGLVKIIFIVPSYNTLSPLLDSLSYTLVTSTPSPATLDRENRLLRRLHRLLGTWYMSSYEHS